MTEEEAYRKARNRIVLWVLAKIAFSITLALVVRKIRKALEREEEDGG